MKKLEPIKVVKFATNLFVGAGTTKIVHAIICVDGADRAAIQGVHRRQDRRVRWRMARPHEGQEG
jgi:hypothetical protein